MSQNSPADIPVSGTVPGATLASLIRGAIETVHTMNSSDDGTAPEYAERGTLWLDDSLDPAILKWFDGTNWLDAARIDTERGPHFLGPKERYGFLPTATASANTHHLTVAAGYCRDSIGVKIIDSPVQFQKTVNAVWAEGNGVSFGGLLRSSAKAGTISFDASGNGVGVGSAFLTDYSVGDIISHFDGTVNGWVITAIADNTNLTVNPGISAPTKTGVAHYKGGRAYGIDHIFVLMKEDRSIDFGVYGNPTLPADLIPSGYVYWRRVGIWFSDDETTHVLERNGGIEYSFYMIGTQNLIVNTSAQSTTPIAYKFLYGVPLGLQVLATLRAVISGAAARYVLFSPSSAGPADPAAPALAMIGSISSNPAVGQIDVWCNTGAEIYCVSSGASTTLKIMISKIFDPMAD